MTDTDTGYREVDHTADWALELWAPEETGILEQAARGMYEMSGVSCNANGQVRTSRRFEVRRPDGETLLVGFLSELLYLLQTDHLAFDQFEFERHDREASPELSVLAVGRPVDSIDKEIKAVTWHEVALETANEGWIGRVTFDV